MFLPKTGDPGREIAPRIGERPQAPNRFLVNSLISVSSLLIKAHIPEDTRSVWGEERIFFMKPGPAKE